MTTNCHSFTPLRGQLITVLQLRFLELGRPKLSSFETHLLEDLLGLVRLARETSFDLVFALPVLALAELSQMCC